jgi:uncharacterized membrane protein YqjE
MMEPDFNPDPIAAGNGVGADGSTPHATPPSPDHAEPAEESGPAKALAMHLLRMLETRMDAAGIALNSEVQSFTTRLQLKLLAVGAMFIAIWGAIVLLAIVLPDPYRAPVLGFVVAAFVAVAVWAYFAANRAISSHTVGSMRWFLDGLRLDFEVLSRGLASRPPATVKTERHQ